MTTKTLPQQIVTLYGIPVLVKSKKRKGKNNVQQVNQTIAKQQKSSTNLSVSYKPINTKHATTNTSNKKQVILDPEEWPTL